MGGTSSPQSPGRAGASGTGGAGSRAGQLPSVGDVIAGKYQIVRVLGEGGMGIVYEATHLRLRQRVAVKMLLPSMSDHAITVTRFEREARAAGQLRNRHVARVMDVDQTPAGLPYMVMEFLEGHDLQLELERRGQLAWDEVVDYVLQACAGMMEAHALGIIHRDLKPSNLFLVDEAGARVVKVLDFGISKVQSEVDAKLTAAESVMGTAMYMSPEQVRSSGTVDVRSDVWSLGVILFELLTGRPPWIGTQTQVAAAIVSEDPPEMRSLCSAPPELVSIVLRALQRNPDARFGSVKELAIALAPLAPSGGAGRIIADTVSGQSGGFPRGSMRPPSQHHEGGQGAPTIVQSTAVSEARMGGPRDGGTAPGWAQPSTTKSRGRTMLVASGIAFVVALAVLGGGMALYLRKRGADGRATASAQPSTTVTSPASAANAPNAIDPPPPQIDPPPPVTGGSPSPSSSAPARPRPNGTKPTGKPLGAPPSAKPPASPPTPAPNPTIL